MNKKILIFACIEKNIGDDLFVYTLCQRYSKVEFVITTEAQYGSLMEIENLNFEDKLDKWMWASGLGQRYVWKSFIGKLLCIYYKKKLGQYEIAVNIVGNAFKNVEYLGWKQTRWIRERINLVDKYFLLSTNFGPYKDERWKKDFDKIFIRMEDVCFRDKKSYDLFKDLPVRYAPDAILTLGKKKNLGGKNILISVIDCMFSAREEAVKKCKESYENILADSIKMYLKEGYVVTLINSNTEQDYPASKRILTKCNNDERVSIFNYDGNFDTLFELYERSCKVIATRLHTIILAWLYGIPVVPIVYDVKVKGILESYDFSGKSFELDQLSNVEAKDIENGFSSYDFAITDELIQEANKQFSKLDDVLRS
ncbi:polysaccharide pyruvyl transferase family protein [Lacrimispora sp.]|uniref:polysaccharide pyruvyl transferase family protein n=1 Tax=Lacrimispora sp. TaxID=2719234 RepID=UPI0028A95334|nr:polysaccharide pyruvyl transferase family protein [Lacrimispora sp.]